MAKKEKSYNIDDLKKKREAIALDLVDVYWEMKPSKFADKDELSEFATLARIAGERGKIGMKAIEKLDDLIAQAQQQKPINEVAGLTNEEIKLLMEFRKNGKSKSTSARSKA